MNVVSRESATIPGYEPIPSFNKHRDMHRFASKVGDGYEKLLSQIKMLVEKVSGPLIKELEERKRILNDTEKGRWLLEYIDNIVSDFRPECVQSLHFPEWESHLHNQEIAGTDETCGWILAHKTFQPWKLAKDSGVLVVSGKPGCGKSVLTRFIHDHLKPSTPSTPHASSNTEIVVAFFSFNDRGARIEKTVSGMMRALLVQIFRQRPALLRELSVVETYQKLKRDQNTSNVKWDDKVLQNLLLQLQSSLAYYIVIDALDEALYYPSSTSQTPKESLNTPYDVISLIKRLTSQKNESDQPGQVKSATFHILLTGRPEIREERFMSDLIYEQVRLEVGQDDGHSLNEAIRRYSQSEVKRLFRGDNDKTTKLVDKITSRAGGIFLWANLVIKILIEKLSYTASFHDLEAKLDAFPEGMTDLYKNILHRNMGQNAHQRRIMLQWALFAGRPLTVRELQIAYHINLLKGTYKSENSMKEQMDLDWFKNSINGISSGLLELIPVKTSNKPLRFSLRHENEKKEVVQFIHQSVKEYLQNHLKDWFVESDVETEADAHVDLSKTCIKYLMLDGLPDGPTIDYDYYRRSEEYESRLQRFDFLECASVNLLKHVNAAWSLIKK
ncbi:MAG: hypothetical protein M1834_008338 [Cirrosporium novae-zelandiae]|nr:MAG: hypothetical protein M1834_008338 [Cirrosporium novae-zelandiae]